MYVRLAFSVAAHLDPEILVIDEVLAVGDLEFQKKCLAKIKAISTEEGKTIIFVSHNMETISNACSRALILEKGRMVAYGEPETVLSQYTKTNREIFLGNDYTGQAQLPGNDFIRVKRVELIPAYINNEQVIDIRTALCIRFEFFYMIDEPENLKINLMLFNHSGELVFNLVSKNYRISKGGVKGETVIPGNFLNDGLYSVSISFIRDADNQHYDLECCLSFEVEDYTESGAWENMFTGKVRPAFPITLMQDF